jgi:hypothetical protein
MAAWLPIVKTALPIIAEVVAVARPMFTKKPNNAERDNLTTQQIEELQTAATQNSDSVKALAAQVQTTFEGLESAATDLQRRLERQQKISVSAIVFGLAGFLLSLYVLAGA